MALQTMAAARQSLSSDYMVTTTDTNATIPLQQRNGVSGAVHEEMLQAGQIRRWSELDKL
jgi:hypothetical protein